MQEEQQLSSALEKEQQQRSFFTRRQAARKRHAWWFVLSLVAAFLLLCSLLVAQLLAGASLAARTGNSLQDLAAYVNPFIGTMASAQNLPLGSGFDSGNVFPGALVPHGMVQWSPDTTTGPGGYRYNQSVFNGFSLTHFSGRGCSAYQDFPFLPYVGSLSPDLPFAFANYATPFSHLQEMAMPGYYSVYLPKENVKVELTATLRSGFGRFTYPASPQASMFINAGGSANGDTASGTGMQIIGNHEVTGEASSGHFCHGSANTYTLYFAVQFDQPFRSQGTWQGTSLQEGSLQSSGSQSGAYLQFDTTHNRVVQARVGLSFVSVNNALLNLQEESPTWNFNTVRAQARAAWDSKLGLIQVQGGSMAEEQTFYTALYHTFIHPNVFSDVNGEYIGFDKKIHQAQGYTQYENFPGWDMYRSLIPLQAILEPQVVGNMLQSLIADAQQGGGGLPRWEVANSNSCGMVGDSMDVVIATSYALGVRNFDTQGALYAMQQGAADGATKSASCIQREGLKDYLSKGYVTTSISASGAVTLEYALDDYAIGQFATALGNLKTAQRYLKRAQNWQKLFDADTGYMVPRTSDGTFLQDFAPQNTTGFAESSSATYTWMVPQDLRGLIDKMGGNQQAVTRLDRFFQKLNDGPASLYAFMGNEPGFGVPWVYDFAGRPDRLQGLIRRIQTQLFDTTPGGLPGNDDGGAMSSWYIFSALGFYPEIPGVAGFALGSPLFSFARLHLAGGAVLDITGRGATDQHPYVQSLSVNQRAWNNPWLPWSSMQNGGSLAFELDSQINLTWYAPIQVP
ncbi:MAG TPA: GH92 family glycosyl hydrolase [Ktedonobacteraceae bacterium]